MMLSPVAFVSCGDDEPDNPEQTEKPDTPTDVLSNTSWKGNVDGTNVTLHFKANGKASETAGGETSNGTYSVSGSTLRWQVDYSVLRNACMWFCLYFYHKWFETRP